MIKGITKIVKSKHILLGIIISCCFFSAFSQERKDSLKNKETITFDGQEFYIHRVKQFESIESISAAYRVSKREMLFHNEQLMTGLTPGMILKIPAVVPSDKTYEADKYIYHKLQRHQSLYYLSKRYKIDLQELLKHNPGLEDGAKRGKVVIIPKDTIFTDAGEKQEKFTTHIVKKNETIYSIAYDYQVEVDSLRHLNSLYTTEISPGMELKIPRPSEGLEIPETGIFDESVLFTEELELYHKMPCNNYSYDYLTIFDIAVMLPFQVEANQYVITDTSDLESLDLHANSERFLELYEGMLIAIEDFRKNGLSLNVHLFDTQKSPSKVKEIIKNGQLEEMELIIGPAYTQNLEIVAEFAKQHQINIVSPLSQKSDLLTYNPYLFQVKPSFETEFNVLAEYLAKFHDQNFLVYHSNKKEEHDLIELFKGQFIEQLSNHAAIETVIYKEIDVKEKNLEQIETTLSTQMDNIVFIPSVYEPTVMDIITKLNSLAEKYNILVVGMPNWQYFSNIELEYMHNLQTHFFDNHYIDYVHPDIIRFIKSFRTVFRTEPSHLSFHGYDFMHYFLSALREYGTYFQFCIQSYKTVPYVSGLQSGFDFERQERSGGFENRNVYLLRYTPDLNILKVRMSENPEYFPEEDEEEVEY
jgi:LysM repeat protein/ABC-type branched-subunit amino acid transport system substrate-binding protein